MEENKNLVISYRYYVEKESAEEKELSERIHNLMLQLPVEDERMDEVTKELMDLEHKRFELMQNVRIKVFKEYPEFLVKDLKTKEELYDFLDEDEPKIHLEDDIAFESVPECLKKIGISETYEESIACTDYLYEKHSEERK